MLTTKWIDRMREPQCAPNTDFPNGMDVDISNGAAKTCSVEVPYPAKRCGTYIVHCDECGQTNAFTTAGRTDDVRRITLGCHAQRLAPSHGTKLILPNNPKMKRTPHPMGTKTNG